MLQKKGTASARRSLNPHIHRYRNFIITQKNKIAPPKDDLTTSVMFSSLAQKDQFLLFNP